MFRRGILILASVFCSLFLRGQDSSFRYPDVPDSLSSPQSRVEYLCLHFWDRADFADEALLSSSKPVLDFIYLLQHSGPEVAAEGMSGMIRRAAPYGQALNQLLYAFNHFLHDSQSPLSDDLLYERFLRTVIASDAVPEKVREPLREPLEVICRNQPGSPAEDFVFSTKDGREMHLYDIEAPYILLMFTNPDCSRCREAEKILKELPDSVRVLAIHPGDDIEGWMRHDYPEGWISGHESAGKIRDERLYEIQLYPCFYLLDAKKTVLLKGVGIEKIVKVA